MTYTVREWGLSPMYKDKFLWTAVDKEKIWRRLD
jgi:hypothetical protein